MYVQHMCLMYFNYNITIIYIQILSLQSKLKILDLKITTIGYKSLLYPIKSIFKLVKTENY